MLYFFTHLQLKKPELLNFASSDKWETVHVWLLQEGRIIDSYAGGAAHTRHSHARLWINSKIASERLGHSKVGITLDPYSPVRNAGNCRRGTREPVVQGNPGLEDPQISSKGAEASWELAPLSWLITGHFCDRHLWNFNTKITWTFANMTLRLARTPANTSSLDSLEMGSKPVAKRIRFTQSKC